MHPESLRHSRVPSGVAALAGATRRADLPQGEWRPRASPAVDMGFCVFNGKPACCAPGCEVTRNTRCFAFAIPVRDYRCCCVAWDGNRGERHDRRCLVFHGISVRGMSLLVAVRRANRSASIGSSQDNCATNKRCRASLAAKRRSMQRWPTRPMLPLQNNIAQRPIRVSRSATNANTSSTQARSIMGLQARPVSCI
ncbi:hypothetical protein SAMN05444172_9178 [Burkholderia sp. GAS332]|nr:hypothetical protein SAMN05444172_9178 [Burkholderia sp. GAS332]